MSVRRTTSAAPQDQTAGLAHVYVIGIRGRSVVKLGTTTQPHQRLQALQIGSPEPLEVLWSCPGDRASETALHQHFAHLRVRGEWFDFGDQSPVAAVREAVEAGVIDPPVQAPAAPELPPCGRCGHLATDHGTEGNAACSWEGDMWRVCRCPALVTAGVTK